MFKIETHLHVSEVSPCAHLSGAQMMQAYADAGYSTVFVTDHYKQPYFASLGDLSWEEKVERFCAGYEAARSAGEALGLTVLFSAELQFVGSHNHYLAYGITKEFLLEYPKLYKMEAAEFYALAKQKGIFVIQAHPLRDGTNTPRPDAADGFEVCNPNPRHENFDDELEALCREHGLYRSGGSDAHRPEDVARGGVASETHVRSVEEFVALIKSGKAKILGREAQ